MKKNGPKKAIKKAEAKAKRRFPGMASLRADMKKSDKRMSKAHKALKKKRN